MTTRGIAFLKKQSIAHEIFSYEYAEGGARAAAEAIGRPHSEVVKSLVFEGGAQDFLFALIDGDANVSTRKLGRAAGIKHVGAAAPRDAERITGYQVGGISPLGSKKRLAVYLDATTASQESIVLNAGARGTLVRVATADLVSILDATVADLRMA